MSRAEIVAEARSWIDTPVVHQGRLKGVGVDCAGHVEMTPKVLGLYAGVVILLDYGQPPDPRAIREALERHLDPVPFAELGPGDVLWLRVLLEPSHLAIVTQVVPEPRMVHALGNKAVDKVVEHGLDAAWRKRIVGCYRYRGVI